MDIAGPFDGVAHATLLMDRTQSSPLRHSLLKLLQSLLCPHDAENNAVIRIVSANAAAFTDNGGVELLVDLLCVAHEGRDRTPIGSSGAHLIAATSFADLPKVGANDAMKHLTCV